MTTRAGRLLVTLVAAASFQAPLVAAATPASTVPDPPQPVTTDNAFLPQERSLDECISALPKPDCGSKERGGWRQLTVFGVMLAGLAAIAGRIAVSVRRRDRARGAGHDVPAAPAS